MVPSRLYELHESKLTFVSRIEFISSKLSNCSAHGSRVTAAVEVPASCSPGGPAGSGGAGAAAEAAVEVCGGGGGGDTSAPELERFTGV